MILVNSMPLDGTALKDDKNPLHSQAVQYRDGIKYLKDTFGESLKLIRPGHPRKVAGIDPRGKEVPNMSEPSPPMLVPLTAKVNGDAGMEVWSYCKTAPKLMPNNLWEATGKRSIFVSENITIELDKDPELAFFLYYKSPLLKSDQLKVDDPAGEAKREGDKARRELELTTGLYGVLSDEDQLKIVAQAWGVASVEKKHADSIRTELKRIVLAGDSAKRTNPSAKGVKEFIEEMKVTDSVRLRSLIMTMVENKKITWPGDGRYKVGERELCRVPGTELERKQEFLTNHLANPANREKLTELLKDVVDKKYLDSIKDEKTFSWLARISGLTYNFKKADQIKELVYSTYVPETVVE